MILDRFEQSPDEKDFYRKGALTRHYIDEFSRAGLEQPPTAADEYDRVFEEWARAPLGSEEAKRLFDQWSNMPSC